MKPSARWKWAIYSLFCGLLAGCAATVLLFALEWATATRNAHPEIIWMLPAIGLLIGFLYHHYGSDSSRGHNLILDEIHKSKNILPLRMAPLVLSSTILTHLFGGSAGREGTSVQMGATLADQVLQIFKVAFEERKILLVAGAGAGFGAAIGTPWAGVVFGMEVVNIGRLKLFAFLECTIASFVAYFTTQVLRAPHTHYPTVTFENFKLDVLFYVAIAGVAFGLTARFFILIAHSIEKIFTKWITYPPMRPLIGGAALVVLYSIVENSLRYAGLGLPVIQDAFKTPSTFEDPLFKILFTALTLGSGFKGGEFIPLVYIGTTLGSAMALVLPVSFKVLATVGFAAVFAGASNTPIACSLMAAELFGISITPYAVVACFVSYYFSGQRGIYSAQKSLDFHHGKLLSSLSGLAKFHKRTG